MSLEKREMSRTTWPQALQRRYYYTLFSCDQFNGAISLIHFEKVAAPSMKPGFNGKPTVILDNGFCWLQLAPEKGHWWLTAMLDPAGKLIQCYFDITLENFIAPQEASFTDLYLDFVLTPPGQLSRLDDDELERALTAGTITEEQFQLALREGAALETALLSHSEQLFDFCKREYKKMLPLCR